MNNLKILITTRGDIATACCQWGSFWSAVHRTIRKAWLDRLRISPSI